ncbi:GGDEF domain-containing protein [Vibrio sp. D404a]|uniref:GGDEF domain-containing protein n=1 Tax=unclassified Vibrio TaxID=2614977 RepID=UPI002557948E|nr:MULTISPECIES: GGDEF domain-containing protein [unclassified Vibrio]MDK9738067.1 GGDEF domain-containing protein [Vibrio sp. D404a]MDK9796358.1 GGDEF domain-containing protein [Vibrio sp. D449a]
MNERIFRQLNVFLAVLCLAFTVFSLLSFHLGMDKNFTITPERFAVKINTDEDHGGGTRGYIESSEDDITLHCNFKRDYRSPFCEVEFVISQVGDGVDLSKYDSVTINMDYQGQSDPRFRFYVRNYDEKYSVPNDPISNKFNRFDFSLDDKADIDLKYFNVPLWWVDYYNHPITNSGVDITNTVSVEVGLGSSTVEGLHKLTIYSIIFHGKVISHITLIRILIGVWILFAIYYICGSVYLIRRGRKRSDEKAVRLKKEMAELRIKATTDPLTGARNRTQALDSFYDFERLAQQKKFIHVALFDLDNFKLVNDKHGHDVGDKVLAEFAGLSECTFSDHFLMYRWGGEEFLLVCLEESTLQCNEQIELFTKAMSQHSWPNDLNVTTSVGLTKLDRNESMRSAIKRADKALYQAKEQGRDRIVYL